MRRHTVLSIGLVALALALAGEASAQKTRGRTRASTTKSLMKGLVAANCGDPKKALEAPDVDWDDVLLKASLLNEAGWKLPATSRTDEPGPFRQNRHQSVRRPPGETASSAPALSR